MADSANLDGLLKLLDLANMQEAGQIGDTASANADNLASVKKQIGDLLDRDPDAIENRIFLLRLNKCMDAWKGSFEEFHRTVRGILSSRLTTNESYFRRDDVSYVIIFGADFGRTEAQLKCMIIVEEILEKIIGRPPLTDLLDVRTVGTESDGQFYFKGFSTVASILDSVMDRLTSVIDDLGTARRGFQTVGPSGIAKPIRFIFRPMLAVRSQIISTFLCIPVQELQGRICVSGYEILGEHPQPKDYLELDLTTLHKVESEIVRLDEGQKKSLVGVPIHFETLADSRRRVQYLDKFIRGAGAQSNRIIFEVIGLPQGIPQARLVELISALRPNARAVIARFSPEHRSFLAARLSGLHAVGIDIYSSLRREDSLIREIEEFAEAASKNFLKSYIQGVRSISLYTAAVAAGYDYASGHALTSVAEAAEGAYVFRKESPYLQMAKTERPGPSQKPQDTHEDTL